MATGSILRAPFTGANPALPSSTTPFDALSDYVSGLSRPTDIARISNGDFFVLTKGSDSVRRYNPSDLSNPSVCVSPPTTNGASLASLATSENNLLYIGVANASFTNKQVVQVVNGSDCSTGTSISLKAVVGSPLAVAVPPVTLPATIAPVVASSETSSGVTTSSFNFGSSVVQTITQGCEPTVTASQASIEYLDNLMTGATPAAGSLGTWDGGKAIPYNGEGGFGIVYTVSSSCEPLEVYNNFLIGSLIDNTYFTNPRIIRCDTGSGCTVIDASGNWPVGGLIQNDLTVGGKVPGFSKFFLANGTIQNDANTFCGFESPLTNTTDQNLAPTFNSGQNLSVKFKLGAAGQQSCKNGPYVTGAIASLSVARVSPTFQPININASGASTTIEPIFNYSPNNQQYQFSLSLDNYASGTYSITVTFLTNDAPAVTTFFTIP